MTSIHLAESDDEVARCFPVMRQLRTELVEADFVPRVRVQQSNGYQLAYLQEGGDVRSVGGFRILENLVRGRVLYVDDLVTSAAHRSAGHGAALFKWLVQRARSEGCSNLELDSGVQRFDAHRFYLANRMIISSHHFALKL
jgi:GNAT superfamily N-acetyltransferase